MTDQPTFDPRRGRNIRSMLVSEAENDVQRGGGLAKRAALLVSLVVAAVLLSGGGVALALTGNLPFLAQPVPPATVTPSPEPTETPTPTPTPTPTTAATPTIDVAAPETWIIDANTVGPLSRGQDRATAPDVLSAAFTKQPYLCDVDVYTSNTSNMQIVLSPGTDGTSVASILINGSLDPASPSPRTKAGIGLDSTADEIVAAYPYIQPPDPRRYPWYSLHQADGSWIDFEIDRDTRRVISIFVGESDYPPSEYCG